MDSAVLDRKAKKRCREQNPPPGPGQFKIPYVRRRYSNSHRKENVLILFSLPRSAVDAHQAYHCVEQIGAVVAGWCISHPSDRRIYFYRFEAPRKNKCCPRI